MLLFIQLKLVGSNVVLNPSDSTLYGQKFKIIQNIILQNTKPAQVWNNMRESKL